MDRRPWEITDLIWSFDANGTHQPVSVAEVVGQLKSRDQHRAARIVERLPSSEGVLDSARLDALCLRVHRELQRLAEELQLPRRIAEELKPIVSDVHQVTGGPVRVVDIGCGIGFVVRWLAAYADWGQPVELVGVDLNPVLVAEAHQLASREGLTCHFVAGDGLQSIGGLTEGSATVVISSGLLHHFDAAELTGFFAAQQALQVAAFAHWDIAPSRIATAGAWVFHQARMRESISRHDGVMSARRAHRPDVLAAAIASGAPDYRLARPKTQVGRWLDVLQPTIGWRR